MICSRRRGRRGFAKVLTLPALLILPELPSLRLEADDPPAAPRPSEIATIDELWADFDPSRDPLEVEVFRTDLEDGGKIRIEWIYFTGQTVEGEKTRVFAYRGAPVEGERLPGVLHIHGGGQTANIEWPRYWARRGFACVSFDFCGDTNLPQLGPEYRREHFTRWGKVQANMMQIGGGGQMEQGPRRNPWHQWVRMARRSITLLESEPRVDRSRIGAFGISVGGTMTWMVAGVDSRVKAAVPIYGNGWESYRHPLDGPQDQPDEAKILWRRLIAPEAHAPRITCPILFLSATNDGHGRIDAAGRTLELVRSEVKRELYTVGYDHHIEPAEGRCLELWMRRHLSGEGAPWPGVPTVEAWDGPVPSLVVASDRPGSVTGVDIHYCLNNRLPMSRFWQRAEGVHRAGNRWLGSLPTAEGTETIFALVTVTYAGGEKVSSGLQEISASKLPSARPTLERSLLISTMETTDDWYFVPAYTDPTRDRGYFVPWRGPGGESGFTFDLSQFGADKVNFNIGTHKLGALPWRGRGKLALAFDVLGTGLPTTLQVKVVEENRQATFHEWTATPVLQASSGLWTTIELEPHELTDSRGEKLGSWDHVDFLAFIGTADREHLPVWRRLRWIPR